MVVGRRSNADDGDVIGVRCQGDEILGIGGEHRASGFRQCNDERIHRRAATSESTQGCASTRHRFGEELHHIASLQEPVLECVSPGMARETLHKDDRRYLGRPELLIPQREYHGEGLMGSLGKSADPARIEEELIHEFAALL
jgi:hypothetical protein